MSQSHAPQLGPGAELRIGGVDLRIVGLLGEGSFGAVWCAKILRGPSAGGEVALKEILCRSETELMRAVMERKLLKFVTGPGVDLEESEVSRDSPALAAAKRFPSLVASEVEALGPDFWQVRLIMTKLAGKPLESVLDACLEELQMPDPQRSQLAQSGVKAETCRLAAASTCALTMLQQLAPALYHLSSQAHHRDITPRNVLVDTRGGAHSWGLVDFGLAVDSSLWRTDLLTHDIGGDGHYWPTSSWFVLAYGAHHLESYPALLHEYEHCLDLHALGVTALRTLMELWAPSHQTMDADGNGDTDWAQLSKMMRLRIAWSRFWEDIAHFWQPIFDAFSCGGAEALERLKSSYAHAGIHHMVSANLCALRAALRQLVEAASLPALRSLCETLLVLIRPGKAREEPATWQAALAALRPPTPATRSALCDALVGGRAATGNSQFAQAGAFALGQPRMVHAT